MGRNRELVALMRAQATAKPVVDEITRNDGRDPSGRSKFVDQMAVDGSKDQTGYQLMPLAPPTDSRHPARKAESDEAHNQGVFGQQLANQAQGTANTAYAVASGKSAFGHVHSYSGGTTGPSSA